MFGVFILEVECVIVVCGVESVVDGMERDIVDSIYVGDVVLWGIMVVFE